MGFGTLEIYGEKNKEKYFKKLETIIVLIFLIDYLFTNLIFIMIILGYYFYALMKKTIRQRRLRIIVNISMLLVLLSLYFVRDKNQVNILGGTVLISTTLYYIFNFIFYLEKKFLFDERTIINILIVIFLTVFELIVYYTNQVIIDVLSSVGLIILILWRKKNDF